MENQTVVMIFDPEYGDRLIDLAKKHTVWVIGSETNRAAAKRIHTKGIHIASIVTIWSSAFSPNTEEDWLSKIDDVERHHGDFAQSPPVSIIEVVGLSVSEAAKMAFRKFDYLDFESTPFGFRTHKKSGA
jgi:hypothetical protein